MARSDNYSLSLQFPLVAAGSALLVGLCLLWMAVRASDYVYGEQEERFAQALAQQVAESLRDSLQSGDLLAARVTLQRYVDNSLAQSIEVRDVEGAALGSAGSPDPGAGMRHRAPILISGDIAGEVVLVVDASTSQESRWRLLFSLLALVAALSLLVFLGARFYARGLATRLSAVEAELALPGTGETPDTENELTRLERRVAALPLDLLRGHAPLPTAAEDFHDSAILFIHLESLARYVDTLSESNLHRYTRRLQQIVQAAAHCYRGEIRVARAFGLVLSFSPQPSGGSEALRAASCARLIALVAAGLDGHTSLSIDLAMALGHCEEDAGEADDIYPELHRQGAVDDLRSACLSGDGQGLILLDEHIAADAQLATAQLVTFAADRVPDAELRELKALGDEQERLLEHQAKLIIERMLQKRS